MCTEVVFKKDFPLEFKEGETVTLSNDMAIRMEQQKVVEIVRYEKAEKDGEAKTDRHKRS